MDQLGRTGELPTELADALYTTRTSPICSGDWSGTCYCSGSDAREADSKVGAMSAGVFQVTLNDAGERNAVIYLPDADSAVFTPEGEVCDDGVDNDEDGLIDANDEDCGPPDVLTSPVMTPDPNSAGWHRQDVRRT